jgi:hypothetical protein
MFLDEAGISAELTNSLYNSVSNSALISTSSFSRQGKWVVIINDIK